MIREFPRVYFCLPQSRRVWTARQGPLHNAGEQWQGRTVPWEEELFGYLEDLAGQAAALYDAERAPELADRSRAEYQQVTLAARLMASVDREVTLEVLGVGAVTGELSRVATGWCL